MEDERTASLLDALRSLAGETQEAMPPPRIERELRGQMRRKRISSYPWWLAAAAAVAVVGFWAVNRKAQPVAEMPVQVPQVVQMQPAEPAALPAEVDEAVPVARPAVARASQRPVSGGDIRELSPLTPWYYSEGLPVPAGGQVVLIRVNPATARRFGVISDGPVPAQLLIGDDGLTRAIRFVQ